MTTHGVSFFVRLRAHGFDFGDLRPRLLGLAHDALKDPPLELGKRRRLLDLHRVAIGRSVLFVVCVADRAAAEDLAVRWMTHQSRNLDAPRLGRFVAGHYAYEYSFGHWGT